MVRRLVLKNVKSGITMLIVETDTKKNYVCLGAFGKRGQPIVVTSQSRRDPALCTLPVAQFVDPNQALGSTLGNTVQDPSRTPQQAALQL